MDIEKLILPVDLKTKVGIFEQNFNEIYMALTKELEDIGKMEEYDGTDGVQILFGTPKKS